MGDKGNTQCCKFLPLCVRARSFLVLILAAGFIHIYFVPASQPILASPSMTSLERTAGTYPTIHVQNESLCFGETSKLKIKMFFFGHFTLRGLGGWGVSFLHFLLKEKLEWSMKRERKKKGNEIGSSNGVRRGVWHPLSCLLKASFFPLLPPPLSADHRYFQRLHSAAANLAVLLKGSQKLKLWALVSLSKVF